MEEFKVIEKFPNYLISKKGVVKHIENDCVRKVQNKYCKYDKSKPWRQVITLRRDGKTHTLTIHRLVLEAFVSNNDNKRTVDHIDKNPFNNNLENLRWATDKEQKMNKIKSSGLSSKKLTIDELNDAFIKLKTKSLREVSNEMGVQYKVLGILLTYMHPEYYIT